MRFRNMPILAVILSLIAATTATAQDQDILQAAREGDLARVEELVQQDPALINFQNDNGQTPMHMAAWQGHLNIVQFLIDLGADINTMGPANQSPLLYAAYEGRTEIVEILLQQGAEFNYQDRNGRTPLHYAARQNHPDVVRYLLSQGADLNIKENQGETELHFAARGGNREIVALLADSASDIYAKTNDGKLPIHTAAHTGQTEAAAFFIEKGVPVICYSTHARALVDLLAEAAGLESNLAEGFEVAGVAGSLCKGDIEGLNKLLKEIKAI